MFPFYKRIEQTKIGNKRFKVYLVQFLWRNMISIDKLRFPWRLAFSLTNYRLESEVSESHFFILETKMRISLIQSRTLRRDRQFLTLSLRLRDETEKRSLPISGIETRSWFIIFILRLQDKNSLDLISVFETRTRILKVAIFPWNQTWTASLFCMQFLGSC